MRIKKILLVLFAIYQVSLQAQNIAAFYDNNSNAFTIFDNGLMAFKEHEQPISFKVGGNCVAFIDNETIFKIYYKGEIIKPYGDNLIDGYSVTHNLVLFNIKKKLLVFDNGKTTVLVNNAGHVISLSDNGAYNYQVSDSLVVFQDLDTRALQVYCNGKIDTLTAAPKTTPQLFTITQKPTFGVQQQSYTYCYRLGKNTLAFIDSLNFKIYYQNKLYKILDLLPLGPKAINIYNNYKCAGNIVAYLNPFTKKLCAFYKGENYIMPTNYLCWFDVGDDMLTYADSAGAHVFYKSKIYDLPDVNTNYIKNKIQSYYTTIKNGAYYIPPSNYNTNNITIKDGILLFYTMGHCKVFCQGEIYEIGDINRSQFKIDNYTIAWIDNQNNLNTLYKGKPFTLSTLLKPSNYVITGNTIWFNVFTNEDKVFFNGKIY